MHNLSALAHAAKAAANLRPSDVSAYFDQIQVWLQQPLNNSELRRLRQQCGDLHHHNEPALWDRHGRWRQRLQLYRPSAATFLWLSQRRGLHLNKVELAL